MKNGKILCLATSLFLLAGCAGGESSSSSTTSSSSSSSLEIASSTSTETSSTEAISSREVGMEIDYETAKESMKSESFSIEIDSKSAAEGDTNENTIKYDEASKVYTLTPTNEKTEYTLKGYLDGKIINTVKGTVLNLNGVYIENTSGDYPIYSDKKIELSSKADTMNYVVSHLVDGQACKAAVYCEKAIEIGGKGDFFAVGNTAGGHGIKGDTVRLKGSGSYYFQGDSDGSAINCNDFEIEKDDETDLKNFKAFMINSKNGIKADKTITIPSGNFFFYNDKIGMKTDEGGSIDIASDAKIVMLGVGTPFAGATTLPDTSIIKEA